MQKISVIIVTYNNQNEIKECVKSILNKTSDTEIIIVDNDSKDDTRHLIKTFENKVKLIESKENLGFGKACNLGVENSTGEHLVFLNPDTLILEKDSFDKLANSLEQNIDYGLVGPRIVSRDGVIQNSVRTLPTVAGAFKEYILGQKGAYDFYLPACQNLCEVESVVGACMIIKKDIFEELGGFDRKYFMYFEDIELCKKVRSLGLRVGFLPEVAIEHAIGKSGVNQKTNVFLHESAKKYHGFLSYHLLQLIFYYQRLKNKIFR